MKSLIYLSKKEIINAFDELRHKPGKLALYIFVFLSIGFVLITSLFTPSLELDTLPSFWMKGILFLFVLFVMYINIHQGLTSGGTLFEMSDVNFLFVSPIKSGMILIYGIIKQTKIVFLSSFFILLQVQNFARFGLNLGALFIVFIFYVLSALTLSMLAMVIYSLTNGNLRRKKVTALIFVAFLMPLLIKGVSTYLATDSIRQTGEACIQSNLLNLIPVAGWMCAAAFNLIEGHLLVGFFWTLLLIVVNVAIVLYVILGHIDYYEDVLVATETAFDRKRAAEEGDPQLKGMMTGKTKVKGTGIRGSGASAFFFKHLRETFREKRWGFFGILDIVMMIGVFAFSYITRNNMNLIIVMAFLAWFKILLINGGKGLQELYSPYIFLVPASSFKKIVWSNFEVVFKALLESMVIFGVVTIILRENFIIYLGAVLTYVLLTMLLVALNYLAMRLFDANIAQGILMILYYLAVSVILAPGLIPAIMVGVSLKGVMGSIMGLLILSGWELIVAVICFYLSRDVLDRADIKTMGRKNK